MPANNDLRSSRAASTCSAVASCQINEAASPHKRPNFPALWNHFLFSVCSHRTRVLCSTQLPLCDFCPVLLSSQFLDNYYYQTAPPSHHPVLPIPPTTQTHRKTPTWRLNAPGAPPNRFGKSAKLKPVKNSNVATALKAKVPVVAHQTWLALPLTRPGLLPTLAQTPTMVALPWTAITA